MKVTNTNTPKLQALVFAILLFATSAKADTIFVDANVVGGTNVGSTWANAFSDLQDGLTVANSGDEIWVATGTYHPTSNSNRDVSFEMKDGVGIYGGFSGTETSIGQRDWVANVCTLSGDLGVQGDSTDNSYHVIFNDQNGLTNTAVLDGFTVTAGNTVEDTYPENSGGGMLNEDSSPTVTNCTFSENSASNSGGGMLNEDSSPTVTNCSFSGNTASFGGGGMLNANFSSPTVTNCTFSGNSASNGGGMFNLSSSSPTVMNCTFSENSASDKGGGMYNSGASPTVTNCPFSGNSASILGGGMYNTTTASPTVTNCTFSGNSASNNGGGGMFNHSPSSPTVTNCILWGNGTEIEISAGASPTVTFSIVQGGHSGTGNFNADPLFVNAAGGDLHLLPDSPAIDTATATGAPATDFDGDARPQGPGFDMGFDEWKACTPLRPISWIGGTNMWNLSGNWDLGFIPLPCNDVEILMGNVVVPAGFIARGKTLEVGLGANFEVELGAELIVE